MFLCCFRTFCLSYLKTNKEVKSCSCVSPSYLFHLLFGYKSMLRAFYLHICVALSIHSQHTTYFESVTQNQLMITLSCQESSLQGFLKTNRDRKDGPGWG